MLWRWNGLPLVLTVVSLLQGVLIERKDGCLFFIMLVCMSVSSSLFEQASSFSRDDSQEDDDALIEVMEEIQQELISEGKITLAVQH